MKKISRYILFALCGLASFACKDIEEQFADELVPMQFTASTEGHASTKTTLEGELGESTHRVLWNPEDEIAILPVGGDGSDSYVFKNTSEENSNTAVFEGKASHADTYYAFYPAYTAALVDSDNLYFNISPNVTYQEGTFSPGGFPMAAKVDAGNDISFHNLCGILALRLTGKETVKSITFMVSNNQIVAGDFSVNMSDGEWKISPYDGGFFKSSSVTMDCGEEGVTLKETEATEFYFVLPPQIYESFDIQIITTEGGMMFKHAGKPLEIKRSVLTPSGALSYVESYAIDLSERGTANCYMVHNAGLYSFDASVIGIGNDGIIADAGYHTADAAINPSDATLLWAEPWDMINELKYDSENKRISFYTTGREGNALIAATDAEGSILWSWHIWATDQPMEQQHKNDNGEFYVLDRNIGATRADKGTGEEWRESIGMYYQWGRKDPFTGWNQIKDSNQMSIAASITDPTRFPTSYPWMTPENHELWDSSQKTIYDPCPTGYVITSDTVWDTYKGQNVVHNQNGWEFTYDGINKTWIPAAAWIDVGGNLQTHNNEVYMWSGKHDKNLHILNNNLNIGSWQLNNGFTVRCMKDDNYVDPLYPGLVLKEIGDITSASATVLSAITNNGKGEIISRGVVYGTTPTVTVENGTKVESTDNTSEFTTQLSGLEMLTKYYVRAYAVNEVGISYSNTVSFYTLFDGDGIDLSADGTANSYIVLPAYCSYTFDCTVKGNSSEEVGEPVYVDVIWETKNTADPVTKGEVISSVELLDGKVKFTLPYNAVPGNALIAVKNITGKIIWSWHIWVAEFNDESDVDIYPGGAMMMDRNLGALNNAAGDVRSFGLYYQWGRKDPFPGKGDVSGSAFAATAPADAISYVDKDSSTDLLDYASRYPSRVIKNSSWNNVDGYWDDIKTLYDPCPPGWRVPDNDVWNGYDSSLAYYPDAGYINNESPKTGKNYWTNMTRYYWNGSSSGNRRNAYDELPVRCMKDAVFTVSNKDEADVVRDVYVTVSGTLTVSDDTKMEAKGFICSTTSDPRIYTEGCIITDEGTTPGDFTSTINGLTPGTTYYIRAYAKGGYNVRYGNVIIVKTKEGADGEGYIEDDEIFEW